MVVKRVRASARLLNEGLDLLTGMLPRLPAFSASRLYCLGYFQRVGRALAADPPDVIVLETFLQMAPLLRQLCPGPQLILHTHDPRLAMSHGPAVQARLAVLDRIVTVSDYLTERFVAAHPQLAGRVFTIYNGVDPAAFVAAEPSLPQRVLFVGRISPEKGVHVLVDAMNRVVEARPDAKLDLAGQPGLLPYTHVRLFHDDPHWASLDSFYGSNLIDGIGKQLLRPGKDYVAALKSALTPKAAAATRFLGRVAHATLPRLYGESSLCVVPSLCDEPFGVPTAEAAAAGVPVVAARAGGVPEIVADGETGLLVGRGDVDAFADAILTLLGDRTRSRRMGEAGRERVSRLFSWSRAAERLEAAISGAS